MIHFDVRTVWNLHKQFTYSVLCIICFCLAYCLPMTPKFRRTFETLLMKLGKLSPLFLTMFRKIKKSLQWNNNKKKILLLWGNSWGDDAYSTLSIILLCWKILGTSWLCRKVRYFPNSSCSCIPQQRRKAANMPAFCGAGAPCACCSLLALSTSLLWSP